MDASPRFLKAFNYTSINEGTAFTNDTSDRGGPTKFGVTLSSLTDYWKQRGMSRAPQAADVAALTLQQAQQFYFDTLWQQLRGDSWLCDGLPMAMFDAATLLGMTQAVKYLQAATHRTDIVVDGIFGSKTAAAIKAMDAADVIISLSAAMGRHCTALAIRVPAQQRFLAGWAMRAGRMLTLAIDTQVTQA